MTFELRHQPKGNLPDDSEWVMIAPVGEGWVVQWKVLVRGSIAIVTVDHGNIEHCDTRKEALFRADRLARQHNLSAIYEQDGS